MKLVNKLPVGRDIYSIALLKSNVHTTTGISAFAQSGGVVSMGGATPGGNRYYTNGFDVTNDFQGIGEHALPAEAIASTSLMPNGANASWSSGAGGVLSQTVREGTNRFKAGYSIYFTPPTSRLLEPRGHNVVNAQGNYYSFVSANTHSSSYNQNLWASGPIVKNKLFFYVLLNNTPPTKSKGVGRQFLTESSSRDKSGMLNITWNITDNQSLNIFGEKEWSSSFGNTYALNRLYDPSSIGAYQSSRKTINNQHFLIGNYHYNISENLSLVLMGGYFDARNNSPQVGNRYADEPYVVSVDPNTQIGTVLSRNLSDADPNSGLTRYAKRGFSGKLNWYIGPNRIEIGADYYKHVQAQFYATNPAGTYYYYDRPGATLGNGYTVPGDGHYVQSSVDTHGGKVPTTNAAAYIQDFWSITPNIVLYGALRDEKAKYKNTQAKTFMHFNELSPRLGLSWDVRGDGTLKVGGTLGKYYQNLPSRTVFGLAQVQTTYSKYYTYTGMDPTTKAPTGISQIGPINQTKYGTPPSPDDLAVKNIKPISQMESSVYAQMEFSRAWSGLAKLSYSNLLRAMNRTCDGAKIDAYAHAHGFPGYDADGTHLHSCIDVNPGSSLEIAHDFAGNGKSQALTIPASYYGLNKSTRKYYALTLQLNHSRTPSEPYFLNMSYTWTHEYGNNSGIIDESSAGAKIYVGQNPQFLYPELQVGDTGNLDQDIRSAFKFSGVYYFSNGLSVGGLLAAHTGQPQSCFGTFTLKLDSYAANNVGAKSFVCDGKVVPLGSAGRLPFYWNLNLSLGYDWHVTPRNDVQFDFHIFNVTNRQGVIARNETFDQGFIPSDGSLPPRNINYGLPSYQAPRTAMFDIRYTWH